MSEINKMWDFSNPGASFDRFMKAFDESSDTESLRWSYLTQAARCLGLQSKFEEAKDLLNQVKLATPETSEAKVRYHLELGRVFNSEGGQKTFAKAEFQKAYELALELGLEYLVVDSAHMMAIVGDLNEQIDWSKIAIDHAMASENPSVRGWLGSLYNNLGWTLFENSKLKEALEMFEGSRQAFDEFNKKGQEQIARWSIARVHRELNQIDVAFEMQKAIETEMKAEAKEDGFVYEELAYLHEIKEEPELAKQYFQKALPLVEAISWFEQYEAKRLNKIREGAGV